jgi:hypothetical protein
MILQHHINPEQAELALQNMRPQYLGKSQLRLINVLLPQGKRNLLIVELRSGVIIIQPRYQESILLCSSKE